MTFYEKYVQLCNQVDKSPSAVAIELKLGKPSVSRWKTGSKPRDSSILKVANYFGVSPEWLKGETDDPSAGIKKDPIPKDGAVSQEKQLLLDMIDGLSDEQKELLALSKKMSDDELKRFIAAMKAMLGESM